MATVAPPAVAPAAPAADEAAGAPTKKKKGKRKLVLVLLVVLVLVAGAGYVKMGKKAAKKVNPATAPGVVVNLDPITLNLADGRFLKVGLALQLSKKATPKGAGPGQVNAADLPDFDGAKALDAAIAILGNDRYGQLLAPGGRATAQKALSTEVSHRYEGEVLTVYFTQFVMQ